MVVGERAQDGQPQSSSTSIPESSKEGSINEVIWCLANQHLDEYDHKLVDHSHQFANSQGRNHVLTDYEAHPFFHRVLDEPVPNRFRMSQLDPYDGTMDPLHHLESTRLLCKFRSSPMPSFILPSSHPL